MPLLPKTYLVILTLSAYTFGASADEGVLLPKNRHRVIDSCLNNLISAGNSADSATKSRIKTNTWIIREQLLSSMRSANRESAMDSVDFHLLALRVKNAFPYKEQRKALRLASHDAKFTVHQAKQIIDLVSFNDEKRDAAAFLLPRIIDLENITDLFESLWSSDNKKFLQSYIDSLSQ